MNFNRQKDSGAIYLYHWFDSKIHFKRSTGIKLELNEWDEKGQMPVNIKQKYLINKEPVSVIKTLNSYKLALATALEDTPNPKLNMTTLRANFDKELNRTSAPRNIVKNGFIYTFEKYALEFEKNKKSNHKSFTTTLSKLKKYSKTDFPFHKVDKEFHAKFYQLLIDDNLANSTIYTHFRNIKTILNLEGKGDQSFFKIKMKRPEEATRIVLTLEEIKLLEDVILDGHLDRARDLWLVGYHTALRESDWSKVFISENDTIEVRSQKTGNESIVPVSQKLREILAKYNDQLPEMSQQKINTYIKDACALAGINTIISKSIIKGGIQVTVRKQKSRLISTHCARRSMATHLHNAGVPIVAIMKVTGHKKIEELQKYINVDKSDAIDLLKGSGFFD